MLKMTTTKDYDIISRHLSQTITLQTITLFVCVFTNFPIESRGQQTLQK